MSEQQKGELVPLAPLWIQKSKDGKMYLSGPFGNARAFIFPNRFKESDDDPDYKLFVTKKPKKQRTDQEPVHDMFQDELSAQGVSKTPTNGMPHPDDITDDEIPF